MFRSCRLMVPQSPTLAQLVCQNSFGRHRRCLLLVVGKAAQAYNGSWIPDIAGIYISGYETGLRVQGRTDPLAYRITLLSHHRL